jgi:molecular chaperone DnaJ
MPGQGGGPPGDLYVDIEVIPEERFERDGTDLVTRARLSFAQAALGASTAIQLPDDSVVTIDVAAGTQPGEVISVKGKGMPRVDGRGRGALQVVVTVEVPRTLNARARDLIRDLETELARQREKVRTGS